MFDLNITWPPPNGPVDDGALEALLAYVATLGYKTVALSTTIQAPVPVQPSPPTPLPTTLAAAIAQQNDPSNTQPRRFPTILRRATVVIDDPSQNHRLQTLIPLYDILAIRPTTEKAFLSACLNVQDYPLISLDLTQRQPYPFRPKPCMTAIGRGLRFEANYAEMVRALDPAARSTWIANFVSLTRATRGRGVLVSSGARDGARALDMRAPPDLVNLLEVFGLQRERGSEALREVPRGIVLNEGIKRTGFRGIVNVVKMVDKKESAEEANERKRKAEQAAAEPQMSKRQMRKAKAQAKAAGAAS
ncbi:hypothetical protein TD95_003917 [Thielaviopsis punctulata]|uniref:RNase P subunit p30 n=1 Tax=Thielaviopsis punctulata TaxID=72032 RepID=A0A0F4ZCG4_9PEZI|nr:hypothetical protein TD95_003917 [Thielaviopsis punctulata]